MRFGLNLVSMFLRLEHSLIELLGDNNSPRMLLSSAGNRCSTNWGIENPAFALGFGDKVGLFVSVRLVKKSCFWDSVVLFRESYCVKPIMREVTQFLYIGIKAQWFTEITSRT